MSNDHFEETYQYLHLTDNEKQATRNLHNFNKLYKPRVLPYELSLQFPAL